MRCNSKAENRLDGVIVKTSASLSIGLELKFKSDLTKTAINFGIRSLLCLALDTKKGRVKSFVFFLLSSFLKLHWRAKEIRNVLWFDDRYTSVPRLY